MNRTLREKKDIILQLLRKRLREANRPGFDELLQGSYSTPIRMGVRPIAALQFDIDIGLRFAFDDQEYAASEVRKWIYDASMAIQIASSRWGPVSGLDMRADIMPISSAMPAGWTPWLRSSSDSPIAPKVGASGSPHFWHMSRTPAHYLREQKIPKRRRTNHDAWSLRAVVRRSQHATMAFDRLV